MAPAGSMEAVITPYTAADMVIRGAGIAHIGTTATGGGMAGTDGMAATAGTEADTAPGAAPLPEETMPLPAGAIVEHTRLPSKTFYYEHKCRRKKSRYYRYSPAVRPESPSPRLFSSLQFLIGSVPLRHHASPDLLK